MRPWVESEDDTPIFVGVAAPDAIGRCLSGTGYATVSEHTGRGVVRADHDGGGCQRDCRRSEPARCRLG